jgi:anti-sigma regulatory factor (Ser/Thr protein kinase)
VAACAAEADFSPSRVREIELIVEEVLVNICRHAYGELSGQVQVNCARDNARRLLLEVIDQGRPFNMMEMSPPDLESDVEHRPVGGLGISLIRALANEVSYRRESGRNVLCLTLTMAR